MTVVLIVVAVAVTALASFAAYRLALGRQFAALQRSTGPVTASGNPADWKSGSYGPVRDVEDAIGRMLKAVSEAAARQQETSCEDDEERANLVQQRLSEQYLRRQAQAVLDETTGMVTELLRQVVDQAKAVLTTTTAIDDSVHAVHAVTREVVGRTKAADDVITALNSSLQRVNGIAGFIATVAEQTNLLSLNATIEAARAGHAGKGFGVVAQEVKELATTTSRSTGEISETIGSLQSEADRMATVIGDVVSGIVGVGDATTAVEDLTSQQLSTVNDLDAMVQAAIGQIELLLTMSRDVDRREHPRTVATGHIQLRTPAGKLEASLLDISEGGLRCVLKDSVTLDAGATIEAIILLDQRLTLQAQVRWQTKVEDRDYLGLWFIEPSSSDRAALRSFVNSLLAGLEKAPQTVE